MDQLTLMRSQKDMEGKQERNGGRKGRREPEKGREGGMKGKEHVCLK